MADYERRLHQLGLLMKNLLADVKKEHPNAMYYVDGTSNLNLMSDNPHDERERPRHDRVLASTNIPGLDGGDW